MTSTLDARALQDCLQRLDTLLQEVERFADPAAQDHTRAIVQVLLDLHGAGLERIFAHLADAGEAGASVRNACAQDEMIAGLLLLHGLHPVDVETRVRQALEQVRPYLHSHGGNVELLSVSEGIVRLRLEGSCNGCPSSAVTMRQTIEEAILGKAPDVIAVQVEGALADSPAPAERRTLSLPLV